MPIRRYEIGVLTIAFACAVPMGLQQRVVPIERAVVLRLGAGKQTNSPQAKPLPVDAAWKPLESPLCSFTDLAVVITGSAYHLDQIQFSSASLRSDFSGTNPLPFK